MLSRDPLWYIIFIGCLIYFLHCQLLALKMKPDYLKALLRRAQSYEATEKLEEALEGNPLTP